LKASSFAGGSGFLGKRLVQQLLETGMYDVWIFDVVAPSPAVPGAHFITGDLTSPESVREACVGKDVVFHVATAAPTAQNAASAKALMQAVNVDGARNVIRACEGCQVKRLIVTSSASVVFDGSPLCSVDESRSYADPPLDYYTSTKAQVCLFAIHVCSANDSTN
jgi:sterol-4alpha-carboxylate 3-dehydrogenase (decarboxylating)